MQGRKIEALQAAEQLAASSGPMMGAMPAMGDAFRALPIFTCARFGEWEAILKMPQPDEAMPATRSARSYARTLALAARDDDTGAKRERQSFERLRTSLPEREYSFSILLRQLGQSPGLRRSLEISIRESRRPMAKVK